MSQTKRVSALTDSEKLNVKSQEELGLRICRHYFPDVSGGVNCATLDEVFVAWKRDPSEQKPNPNQIAIGLGVLFGLCFMRSFSLEWRVVEDQFGTDLALCYSPPDKAQVIVSPLHLVAKRVKETAPWFEGTYGALGKQLVEWGVPVL